MLSYPGFRDGVFAAGPDLLYLLRIRPAVSHKITIRCHELAPILCIIKPEHLGAVACPLSALLAWVLNVQQHRPGRLEASTVIERLGSTLGGAHARKVSLLIPAVCRPANHCGIVAKGPGLRRLPPQKKALKSGHSLDQNKRTDSPSINENSSFRNMEADQGTRVPTSREGSELVQLPVRFCTRC
jgi:hypothetical protein